MKHVRLSFLLHTLLVLVMLTLPVTKGNGDQTGAGGAAKREEAFDVTIIDPPKKEDEPVVTQEDAELEALKKLAPHAGDKCEHFYGGIGINDSGGGVAEVHEGYPAARAGIEVGDIITSDEPIRGEIGTPVTVVVLRGMRTIVFHLTRDKICIS